MDLQQLQHAMQVAKYNYDVQQYDKMVAKLGKLRSVKKQTALHAEIITIATELLSRRKRLMPDEDTNK